MSKKQSGCFFLEHCVQRQMLLRMVRGDRRSRRPTRTWSDDITGCTLSEAVHLTTNRNQA